jgi:hypothetical protein
MPVSLEEPHMTTPAPGTAAPTNDAAPVTPAAVAPEAPAAPPAPASPAPAAPAADAPATEPQGKAPKFEGEFDPAKFERLVENLRGEVAAEREKRTAAEKSATEQAAQQQADLVKKLAAAFGLQGEEAKPPSVEELTKQLADSHAETEKTQALARQRDVELAVYRSAGSAGGDADALLDSRAFVRSIRDLDPAAKDFAEQVAAAVKTAVDSNPKLALKQPEAPAVPARGGADLTGTPGGKRQLTEAEVKRMKPDDIDKARRAGQLRDYLSGAG